LKLDDFDNGSAKVFTLSDTDYKNICSPHDKRLNDPTSIVEFHEMFEIFHEFLNSDVCINIKLNPTQLFALFQYIVLNVDMIHLIYYSHIKVFCNEGNEACYKKMWENNTSKSTRINYYKECFSSLNRIIENVECDVFEEKISKKLKSEVWIHWFKDTETATCPCGTIITKNDNHCGHILARSKGGKTIVDNLRPICISCNLRMKTRNLNDYFIEIGYMNKEK
jgi:5-methylcytosine-specific restriction endonuclease McrA